MPQKGSFTAADAVMAGLVPAGPIGRAIARWCDENWWMDEDAKAAGRGTTDGCLSRLGSFTGIHPDTLRKVRYGQKEWLGFDNADRVITFIDPHLWRDDPELAEVYQSFDFAWLDLQQPTCPEADPLSDLEFLSDRLVGALVGVSQSTVNRARRHRREGVAQVAA